MEGGTGSWDTSPYPESMGSTAQTLEYAYDDFCGYQLARMTGNKFYEGDLLACDV